MSQFFKKKASEDVELRDLADNPDDIAEVREEMADMNPLSFYRTNDVFWYNAPNMQKDGFNWKMFLFMAFFLGALIIIVIVTIFTIQAKKDAITYTHDKIRLVPYMATPNPLEPHCRFIRNCTASCSIELEHEIGCCIGCGLTTDCNFDTQIAWQQVEALPSRQRIWLFVSTNGKGFFQTGFAPYITNTSGTAIISNGCYSAPNQQIILVACLSTSDLQNKATDGFPADSCSSTFGICISTNGVWNLPLDACKGGVWEGNSYTTSWDGPKYNGDILLQPSTLLLVSSIAVLLLSAF